MADDEQVRCPKCGGAGFVRTSGHGLPRGARLLMRPSIDRDTGSYRLVCWWCEGRKTVPAHVARSRIE